MKDAEDVARKYCGDNLSRFLRELIQQYDEKQNVKKNVFTIQTLAYLLISICFLIIGVSFYSNIVAVLVPSVTILCGIFLFVYCFILVKKQKTIIGGI